MRTCRNQTVTYSVLALSCALGTGHRDPRHPQFAGRGSGSRFRLIVRYAHVPTNRAQTVSTHRAFGFISCIKTTLLVRAKWASEYGEEDATLCDPHYTSMHVAAVSAHSLDTLFEM